MLADEEAMAQARSIYRMVLGAMAGGTVLKVKYTLAGKPTVQDLDGIEKAVNGLLTSILRGLGLKVPRGRMFKIDLSQYQHIDDGEDNVVNLTLDFAKLIPGERPPELLAAVDRMLAKLPEDSEVQVEHEEVRSGT